MEKNTVCNEKGLGNTEQKIMDSEKRKRNVFSEVAGKNQKRNQMVFYIAGILLLIFLIELLEYILMR